MIKVLVVLRHENSLNVVRDYLIERQYKPLLVALDPVELPEQVPAALATLRAYVAETPDVIVLGTKVYDDVKAEKADPPQRLIEFLDQLKTCGTGQTPIVLTHLVEMPATLLAEIKATGLNITYVENDNLKRDGMNNLGPQIMAALKR